MTHYTRKLEIFYFDTSEEDHEGWEEFKEFRSYIKFKYDYTIRTETHYNFTVETYDNEDDPDPLKNCKTVGFQGASDEYAYSGSNFFAEDLASNLLEDFKETETFAILGSKTEADLIYKDD